MDTTSLNQVPSQSVVSHEGVGQRINALSTEGEIRTTSCEANSFLVNPGEIIGIIQPSVEPFDLGHCILEIGG
jgi:hypothetical protein